MGSNTALVENMARRPLAADWDVARSRLEDAQAADEHHADLLRVCCRTFPGQVAALLVDQPAEHRRLALAFRGSDALCAAFSEPSWGALALEALGPDDLVSSESLLHQTLAAAQSGPLADAARGALRLVRQPLVEAIALRMLDACGDRRWLEPLAWQCTRSAMRRCSEAFRGDAPGDLDSWIDAYAATLSDVLTCAAALSEREARAWRAWWGPLYGSLLADAKALGVTSFPSKLPQDVAAAFPAQRALAWLDQERQPYASAWGLTPAATMHWTAEQNRDFVHGGLQHSSLVVRHATYRLLAERPVPELAGALLDALVSETSSVPIQLLGAVAALEARPEVKSALATACSRAGFADGTTSPYHRSLRAGLAVSWARHLPEPEATEWLAAQIDGSEPEVAEACVLALGPTQLSALAPALLARAEVSATVKLALLDTAAARGRPLELPDSLPHSDDFRFAFHGVRARAGLYGPAPGAG